MMNKKSGRGSIVLRLLKTIREFYPVMMPVTVVCIVFSAVVSSVPAIFMQNVIAVVEQSWRTGDWASVGGPVSYTHLLSHADDAQNGCLCLRKSRLHES